MTSSLTFHVQRSTLVALLLLVVVCSILWGYSFYKECRISTENINSKEKFSVTEIGNNNSCLDPRDDLTKSFNPKIKGYNDDLLYENKSDKPWQHHDIQGSLPLDPIVKYPKAYYYEFDNKKYMDNLKTALAVPCALLADAVNDSSWSKLYTFEDVEPTQEATQEVNDAYNACIQNVATKLNTSSAMVLPGYTNDTSIKSASIQVVHDIMRSYRKHLKEKSMYLIDMELLLYRENKFEGKHVKISCTAKFLPNRKVWFTNVVAAELLGVVPEDQIALFPVNASNPFDIENLEVDNDVSADGNSLYTIECVVDKKNKNDKNDKNDKNKKYNENSQSKFVCSIIPSKSIKKQ
jgi:hypothetical protein